MKNRANKGFSLVEITISIGIVAFALLAIVGLIPVGMNSAKDAADDTRTSTIAQDACNRIRARLTTNDKSSSYYFSAYASGQASYLYYTSEGVATAQLMKVAASGDKPNAYKPNPGDFYRAKVVVKAATPAAGTYPAYDPRSYSKSNPNPEILCATVEIGWPVDTSKGSVLGTTNTKATYVFYLRKP